MKLILKKSKYQNIITLHAQSIHVQIEFVRRNTFNVQIATAKKREFFREKPRKLG